MSKYPFHSLSRYPSTSAALVVLPLLVLLASCASDKIVFNYPDEEIDLRLRSMKMPALYLDLVHDMRPVEQRDGQGHFFGISYPKDDAWERPVTEIYAEALAQDVEQTHLVELVPLRGQADYVLSVDLLSMGCRLQRSPASFLLSGAIGAGLGMALGDDASQRTKMAIVFGAAAIAAIPLPTQNRAEAEVRMTLKDRSGNLVWQKSCLGEFSEKVYLSTTARQDQQLVDKTLTKAVKRCNACLIGQLRQALLEMGGATGG